MGHNLQLRILSGLVLGFVSLWAVQAGVLGFCLEACVLGTAGIIEFCAMARRCGLFPRSWTAVPWGLALMAGAALLPAHLFMVTVAFVLLSEMALTVMLAGRWTDCMVTVFIELHAWLFSFAILLRRFSGTTVTGYDRGAALVFVFLFASAGCDAGAYITGRLFGRTPLAPRISPKKTWEGTAGGLLVAFVLSLMFASRAGLPLPAAAGIALAVGIASQLGDLWESLLKRESGVKDAGRWMVGHGGVLDRVDSFIYAAPVGYAAALLLLPGAPP